MVMDKAIPHTEDDTVPYDCMVHHQRLGICVRSSWATYWCDMDDGGWRHMDCYIVDAVDAREATRNHTVIGDYISVDIPREVSKTNHPRGG